MKYILSGVEIQEAQLSQKDHATLRVNRVIEYFA